MNSEFSLIKLNLTKEESGRKEIFGQKLSVPGEIIARKTHNVLPLLCRCKERTFGEYWAFGIYRRGYIWGITAFNILLCKESNSIYSILNIFHLLCKKYFTRSCEAGERAGFKDNSLHQPENIFEDFLIFLRNVLITSHDVLWGSR